MEASPFTLLGMPDEVLLRIVSFLSPKDMVSAGHAHEDLRRIILDEAFKKARQNQKRRFLDDAIAYFTTCLDLDCDHRAALDERAIAYFNISNRRASLADLRRSVELARDEPERLVFLSVVYEMSGELQQSMQCSRACIALDSGNARAYFELGYVLQELPFKPDHEAAVAAYTRCLELGYHRRYVAFFNRGWAQEALGKTQQAMEDYVETLRLSPHFSQAARSIARLLARDPEALMKRLERCDAMLAEGEAAGLPKSHTAHLWAEKAYCWDSLERDEAVVECYTRAIEAGHPRRSVILNSRGWVWDRLNRPDLALQDYQMAVDIDPLCTQSLEHIAKHRLRRGDRAGAVKAYEEMARRDPLSPHPLHSLAYMARDIGDFKEAFRLLEDALKINPNAESVETHCFIAEIASGRGDFVRSYQSYCHVLKFYPNALVPLKLRANCLLRMGRLAEAEQDLRKCLQVDPKDEVASINLGSVLYALARFPEAHAIYCARLAANPQDWQVLSNLAYTRLKLRDFEAARSDFEALHRRFPIPSHRAVLDSLSTDPDSLVETVYMSKIFFCSQMSFETWMRSVGTFIEQSEEFTKAHGLPQPEQENFISSDDDDFGSDE